MEREFYDLKLEKSVLKCLANDNNFISRISYKGIPDEKIFSELSNRAIFKCIVDHYNQRHKIPSKEIVNAYVNRIKVTKGFSKRVKENTLISIDRVFSPVVDSDIELFDSNYNELINLYEIRSIQFHIKKMADSIDNGDIESLKNEVQSFSLVKYDESVEEFDFADGFKERFEAIKEIKRSKYEPIPTGIPELDAALDGGIFKEYFVIAGSSSTGKSSLLHQICKNAAHAKKNGILFTIEMDKVEAATRIDADISNTMLRKFRNPLLYDFNNEDVKRWYDKIKEIKKSWGIFHIVAFLKGATVRDIAAKAQEYMKRKRIVLDYIAIDYLNDLQPIGDKFQSVKGWDAQAQISWDLHLLNKSFINYDGSKGIPVITAAALRGASRGITASGGSAEANDGRRNMDERDMGMAKIIYNHSNGCLGIRELNENVNQLVIMKQRAGRRNQVINVYPNFQYGRFHDEALKSEAMQMVSVEAEDSDDGIIEENDE